MKRGREPVSPVPKLARGRTVTVHSPRGSPSPSPVPLATPRKKRSEASGSGTPFRVFLRVRPLVGEEKGKLSISVESETAVSVSRDMGKKTFTFSKVFGPQATQKDIYEGVCPDLVRNFFLGQDGFVFAYGVTNSGKTYTVLNSLQLNEQSGIVMRLLRDIMDRMEVVNKDVEEEKKLVLKLSLMEIYNENVKDLIRKSTKTSPSIVEDSSGRTVVRDITQRVISSFEEGSQAIALGCSNRQTAATSSNAESSRSHCIISFILYESNRIRSIIRVADLAGSERATKTNATGKRLVEASAINSSLLVFGRCFSTLLQNQQSPSETKMVVPVRESRFTRIVQDAFLKTTSAVLIVNASPFIDDAKETANALQFGSLAQQVVREDRLGAPSPAKGTPCTRASIARVLSERDELQKEKFEMALKIAEMNSDRKRENKELDEALSQAREFEREAKKQKLDNDALMEENRRLKEELQQSREQFAILYEKLTGKKLFDED